MVLPNNFFFKQTTQYFKVKKKFKSSTKEIIKNRYNNLQRSHYVISHLGLPAFNGAGVLYNLKIFSYFFNSLGAYKVDRKKKTLLNGKTYTEEAIINDCHNLFYPGGTRSRSGSIKFKIRVTWKRTRGTKRNNKKKNKNFIVPVLI